MAVLNVHSRRIPLSVKEAGALLDTLASDDDRVWPTDHWPRMRLDRPLAVGAVGGHGPVRYRVEQYVPGRWVRFRFTGPRGFDGFHEFTVEGDDDSAVLAHLLIVEPHGPARLTWPLFFRWMHDAVAEDALDRVERDLTGTVREPARWSRYVRLLRAGKRRFARPNAVRTPVAVTGAS
ncbi:hypothetical protein [Nocardia inohanensis]|uniref:hypothetical protein n=1 Tax=Nocardia inohanensis TaxID=209246 RepID=UPI0008365150|nr:hypothetical protein [Nocardia inohanensis]